MTTTARSPAAEGRWPILFAYGFRPFFRLAGVAGTVLVPAWLAALAGALPVPARLEGFVWHAHEMIHGFTLAVIAGFLLTAVPNWTRGDRVRGGRLAALAGLWVAGRAAVAAADALPPALVAAVDAGFPAPLALAAGIPIYRARRWRNAAIPPLLVAMAAADVAVHLPVGGDPLAVLRTEVSLLVVLLAILGGRLTPLFTRNALRDRVRVRERGRLDDAALASTVVVAALVAVPGAEAAAGVAALAAAALNGARMVGWGTAATLRAPILWVLHAGYAWIAIGLALQGASLLWPTRVPRSPALHALTVGAIGTYVLGMMSRVSLGHTGRPLRAPRVIAAAYVAVTLAAAIRVAVPLAAPTATLPGLHASGALWTLAFAAFVAVYTPILTRPRADGKPG